MLLHAGGKGLSTHRISIISTAKEERPSRGESCEKLRSMKASVYGRLALAAGTIRPQLPNNATAQRERRIVDLPAMLGPAHLGCCCRLSSRDSTLGARIHHAEAWITTAQTHL